MIYDRRTFTETLKKIDWTFQSVHNYYALYRNLEAMSQVIDYARRGNGKDPDHHQQKEFHDEVLGELTVQFDNYQHDIKRAVTAQHEADTETLFQRLLDFGNTKINFYFGTVATFDWASNRREVTPRGETMVTFVREIGGIVEEHWNHQCTLQSCPLLHTGGKAGYVTAKRHLVT